MQKLSLLLPEITTMPAPIAHEFGRARGRIIDLLQRAPLTPNEIADRLGVTHNAVRSHIAALSRLGLVRKAGLQHGSTRPATLYELAPRAEYLLSHAYIPFMAHLLQALGEQLPPQKVDSLMRTVGRNLAAEWPRPNGPLRGRVVEAIALLNDLGALTELDVEDHGLIIRGYRCSLAEAVNGRPEVCRAVESLLQEFLRVPVEECCDRTGRPRCCFRIRPRQRTDQPSTLEV